VDDEDAPEGMQWWRIEYDVQVNGAKVIKTKSTQDDVIRAVELEHNQALLVYASDQAISDEHEVELSSALDEFIYHDDEYFNSELQRMAVDISMCILHMTASSNAVVREIVPLSTTTRAHLVMSHPRTTQTWNTVAYRSTCKTAKTWP
jgi:hypothetical protein